jgi:serine/threonine protein kinase
MIRLRLETSDGQVHRTFRETTVVVGRSRKCDLPMPDNRGLSRFHCRLTLASGRCVLEDLGSRNGTTLNGRLVTEPTDVHEGDVVGVGKTVFRIDSLREDEPTEELVLPCLHCGHLYSARKDACPRCGTEARHRGRSRALGSLSFPGFRLIRKIGSGGMGIVFEAEELGADRRVALKVLRPHLARDARYLVRFVEEIRVLTSLRHDAIVQVFGRGKEEDLHYITMELIPGPSARDAMRDLGHIPWSQAVRIAWGAARGLNAAYQQAGVVHGDVKPGNFLLANASTKLCDFGLAQVDLKRRPSRDRAAEDERRGTAAYAAPERFLEGALPTIHSDMYSLGVSLFQMATGHLPFRGGSVAAFFEGHSQHPVPDMTKQGPDVSPALQLLVERLMAKRPQSRYADYPALLADLSLLFDPL